MSEDFTQCLDIHSDLHAPGCKSMSEDMKIHRPYPGGAQDFFKKILVIAGLYPPF